MADDEHEAWFAGLTRSDSPYFAIERCADDVHVGNIWLVDVAPNQSAELRIVLGQPGGANAGHGTEAIRCLCDYAFRVLRLIELRAFVFDFNARARRAFEKAGFEAVRSCERRVGGTTMPMVELRRLDNAA